MPQSRLANWLGALGLGLGDYVDQAVQQATGWDPTANAALVTVLARPAQSIGELAEALGLSHSGAVRTVNRLQAQGLMTRGRGADQRTASLGLTEDGRRLANRALAARRDVLGRLVDALSPTDQQALIQVLPAMLALLPHSRADAYRICRLCEHAVCRHGDCPVGSAVP